MSQWTDEEREEYLRRRTEGSLAGPGMANTGLLNSFVRWDEPTMAAPHSSDATSGMHCIVHLGKSSVLTMFFPSGSLGTAKMDASGAGEAPFVSPSSPLSPPPLICQICINDESILKSFHFERACHFGRCDCQSSLLRLPAMLREETHALGKWSRSILLIYPRAINCRAILPFMAVLDDFIEAPAFEGSKEGFVFKMGKFGLGYYSDGYRDDFDVNAGLVPAKTAAYDMEAHARGEIPVEEAPKEPGHGRVGTLGELLAGGQTSPLL